MVKGIISFYCFQLEVQKLEANGGNSVPTEAADHMDVTTAQADVTSANDTSLIQCDVEQAVTSADIKDNQVDSFHSIPLPMTDCIIRQSEIAKAADREKLDDHKIEVTINRHLFEFCFRMLMTLPPKSILVSLIDFCSSCRLNHQLLKYRESPVVLYHQCFELHLPRGRL